MDRSPSWAGVLGLLLGIALLPAPRVNDPLVGMDHVRMNETAALARNYFENSMRMLYTQVDCGGCGPGYVEEVFHLYAFFLAAMYKAVGVSDAVGRAVSLGFYVASALLLLLLARRLSSTKTGLFASLFFASAPLGLYYGTSFQPESFYLVCFMATVLLFVARTDTNRDVALWGSAVAFSAALMMKPANVYLGLPLVYLCYRRFGWRLFRRWKPYLFRGLPHGLGLQEGASLIEGPLRGTEALALSPRVRFWASISSRVSTRMRSFWSSREWMQVSVHGEPGSVARFRQHCRFSH